MLKRMFSAAVRTHAGHLREYESFGQFKAEINHTLDQHMQTHNSVSNYVYAGMSALGSSVIILYCKVDSLEQRLAVLESQSISQSKIDSP